MKTLPKLPPCTSIIFRRPALSETAPSVNSSLCVNLLKHALVWTRESALGCISKPLTRQPKASIAFVKHPKLVPTSKVNVLFSRHLLPIVSSSARSTCTSQRPVDCSDALITVSTLGSRWQTKNGSRAAVFVTVIERPTAVRRSRSTQFTPVTFGYARPSEIEEHRLSCRFRVVMDE